MHAETTLERARRCFKGCLNQARGQQELYKACQENTTHVWRPRVSMGSASIERPAAMKIAAEV